MLAVIFVMALAIIEMLAVFGVIVLDWALDRHFERQMIVNRFALYRAHVENCTARLVEPRSLPEMLRAWKSV